jgi:hypothetical protein
MTTSPDSYQKAYTFLLSQLSSEIRGQVERAVKDDTYYPPEVDAFVKSVIAFAERDEKKL